jgi:hypothetical protein
VQGHPSSLCAFNCPPEIIPAPPPPVEQRRTIESALRAQPREAVSYESSLRATWRWEMGRGNSGTGWSMSIWPRRTSTEGSDSELDRQRARLQHKKPTKGEIEASEQRKQRGEQKLLRSFISQCAASYAARKLTATNPAPPPILRRPVLKAGGNIGWLETNRQYQVFFHTSLCRLTGRNPAPPNFPALRQMDWINRSLSAGSPTGSVKPGKPVLYFRR